MSLPLNKYRKVAVDFCSDQGARKEHSISYVTEEQRRALKTWSVTDLVVMTLGAMKEYSHSYLTEEQRRALKTWSVTDLVVMTLGKRMLKS